jgi:acetyl-CoA carboxylase biotin carboxyl carrier protein
MALYASTAAPRRSYARCGPPGPARRAIQGVSRTGRYGYGMAAVEAHITGTVWKIECSIGDQVEEGDTVAILESMKMEMPVEAEEAGTVAEILCEEGQAVSEGDPLVRLA